MPICWIESKVDAIEVGKLAVLVVLDRVCPTSAAEDIQHLKVGKGIVDGKLRSGPQN